MKTFIERLSNLKTNTGCWEFQGYRNEDGYGQLMREGKTVRVHRAVWEIVFGEIPAGLCVLHTCDNPPCANPAHLWLGTKADNNSDRETKDRGNHPQGESHCCAKLTEVKVHEIRDRYAFGDVTQRKLAARFGVSQTQISYVVRRKRWKHVA